MAQELIDEDGLLDVPGGYAEWQAAASATNIATTGIVALLGEADSGPDYTQEDDLDENFFGPTSLAAVLAKYKSGPIVDAYRTSVQPMLDPDITGAPLGYILVKTNVSDKASGALPKVGGGTYGTLSAKSQGLDGNLIYFTVAEQQAEVKATTGAFTFIPPVGTVDAAFRANGGAKRAYSVAAAQDPATFVAGVDALADVSASGGANRAMLSATHGDLAVAAVGNVITLTLSVIAAWDTTPTAGDTLVIPAGSAVAGASNENVGAYVITAATATTVTATKLSDAGKPGAVIGTITAPAAVAATPVVGANADAEAFAPVTITLEGTSVVDGLGKALEIADEATGTDQLVRTAYLLASTTQVSWVSKTGAPKILTSASEQRIQLNVNRQSDSMSEDIQAGGQVGLQLGYLGTTATATIAIVNGVTKLTTAVAGGTGANLDIKLSSYATIADLAAFISAQAGYTAQAATAAVGQMSPLGLDEGTFGICGEFYKTPGQIKFDAYDFFKQVSQQSVLVQLGSPDPAAALAGLPAVQAAAIFLAGGTRGGTTQAAFQAAIDACEAVDANFFVPCISRDAALDIADGLTDSTSTYAVDDVNAYLRTHATKMSALKRRMPRQFLPSKRDTYVAVKKAAANLAGFRSLMSFQDMKDIGGAGAQQFPPYITAAKAAAAQAAGFYKAIFFKQINCQGAVQAAGDWKPKNQDNVSDALKAGLAPIVFRKDIGWYWASDQNTYLRDNNTILNSFQAVYAADTASRTAGEAMEKAFVGKSFADLSEAQIITAFGVVMNQLIGDKLVVKTAKMPLGYQNVVVKIGNGAIEIVCDATLTTACYFAKVKFLFSETQS